MVYLYIMYMETHDYNKTLLDAVRAKLSADINPVWFVMDILSIGKEAAYRRLRGEVCLNLQEAVLLSKKLGISLDEITENYDEKIQHLHMRLAEFENPDERDYHILREYIDLLLSSSMDTFSHITISTNTFPQQIYLGYKSLLNFFLFKWIYHNKSGRGKAYHQVKIPNRMQQIFDDSLHAYRQFASTCFIFDKQIGQSLVTDLKHFVSIGLIREEDKENIRREAYIMLNYMEQICINGVYENGNKVQIYISDISFERSYYNLKIHENYLSIIEACILNGVASSNKISYLKMEEWIDSRRRLSTLITQSGEFQRIEFFSSLRKLLDEL